MQFTVVARAGSTVTRHQIETVIAAQGKRMERPYRVEWEVDSKSADVFANRGQPFVAPLLSGGTLDFATVLERQPIVLTFWASWCKPCIVEAPQLAALHGRYAERGVKFLAVSIDEPDDYDALRKVVNDLQLPYDVALDPEGTVLAKYAEGASIPLTFVIAVSGDVSYRHQNFQPGDERELEQAISAVLAPDEGGAN